ncbi:metalloregulator ArsR/SmtB family transcription factor [Nodosilinea sp. E11]|nr:metalloregulator ArsR/SmtB family transcription factor [Nodosilinea sp. E11]WOD41636.1 metalloregulator ArsR/SmtB family transcription factor [Nodosilinea sp. E11]
MADPVPAAESTAGAQNTGAHSACAHEAGTPAVAEILSIDKAQRMAEFFGVLGDPNRWRILSALALREMRVGELAAAVAMSESAVSHQLRILRATRLVSYRKRGRNVLYCLKDDHVFNLYREASEHLDEPMEE